MTAAFRLRWPDVRAKARWLTAAAFRDAALPYVAEVARRFAAISTPLARAEAIHAFVRDGLRYVRDLGGEEFADAAVVLRRGWGDCDDKTRVVVALIHAAERLAPVGLTARPVCFFPRPDVFSHIAAELRWPDSRLHPRATAAGWIRCETILAGCPLGAGTEAAQRDACGRVLYA